MSAARYMGARGPYQVRADGRAFRVGDLLLMRYGNGSQPARVEAFTSRGYMRIARFITGDGWRISKAPIKLDDERLLGSLPASDGRRSMGGFSGVAW